MAKLNGINIAIITLYGHAVTVEDGGLTAFEGLRIEFMDGRSVFVASPNGAAPVRFYGEPETESRTAFANPNHDFPQRIMYHRTTDGLRATISKMNADNRVDIDMTPC